MSRPKRETELLEEVPMRVAMATLGKCRRWFYDRIKDGTFEAFAHGNRNMTLSKRSLVAYQQSVRVRSAG